jgi:hypothetical protein
MTSLRLYDTTSSLDKDSMGVEVSWARLLGSGLLTSGSVIGSTEGREAKGEKEENDERKRENENKGNKREQGFKESTCIAA